MFQNTILTNEKSLVTRPPRTPDWKQTRNENERDEIYTFQNKVDAQDSWQRVENRLKVDESLCTKLCFHTVESVTVVMPTDYFLQDLNTASVNRFKFKR